MKTTFRCFVLVAHAMTINLNSILFYSILSYSILFHLNWLHAAAKIKQVCRRTAICARLKIKKVQHVSSVDGGSDVTSQWKMDRGVLIPVEERVRRPRCHRRGVITCAEQEKDLHAEVLLVGQLQPHKLFADVQHLHTLVVHEGQLHAFPDGGERVGGVR